MPSDSASSFGWASSDGRVYKLKTDMQLHSFEYYVYIKWGMRIIITHVVYELPTLWDNLPVFAKNLLSYCKCFLLWTSKLTAIDNCISHVKSTRPLRWIGTLRLYWWHLRRWVVLWRDCTQMSCRLQSPTNCERIRGMYCVMVYTYVKNKTPK